MNHDIHELCFPKSKEPPIRTAGKMVGIDLENPIDLSQMSVGAVYHDAVMDERTHCMHMERIAELKTWIMNEFGEREELFITMRLKSNRRAKL